MGKRQRRRRGERQKLAVNSRGLLVFRGWAVAFEEEREKGAEVPEIQDVDAAVEWLDDRGLLLSPEGNRVERDEARSLFVMMLRGGELEGTNLGRGLMEYDA